MELTDEGANAFESTLLKASINALARYDKRWKQKVKMKCGHGINR